MVSPFDRARAADAEGEYGPLLRVFCWYLIASAVGHTAWEIAHVPLYTIWTTGSPARLTLALIHCTIGDLLIATWTFALAGVGLRYLPLQRKSLAMGIALVVLGVVYTGFSEWRNVYVEGGWAYSKLMPTVTIAGFAIGLSPLAQWVVVPAWALWFALRRHQREIPDA